jgi:lipoic acid synthetase
MRGLGLHTVCEEARCPNIGECWGHGTATFMILGDVCTRACAYCAVAHGRPDPVDATEPGRVASAIHALGLDYVVITSVDRDDLPDGGASAFAETIRKARVRSPTCRIEVLIPDFRGDEHALRTVLSARPDVLNHNTETVPRLYRMARSGGRYSRTLELRYYHPDEFRDLKAVALGLGFAHVESGPLVRSSYHAHETADAYEKSAPGDTRSSRADSGEEHRSGSAH